MQKQDNHKCEASLGKFQANMGYKVKPCLKPKNKGEGGITRYALPSPLALIFNLYRKLVKFL